MFIWMFICGTGYKVSRNMLERPAFNPKWTYVPPAFCFLQHRLGVFNKVLRSFGREGWRVRNSVIMNFKFDNGKCNCRWMRRIIAQMFNFGRWKNSISLPTTGWTSATMRLTIRLQLLLCFRFQLHLRRCKMSSQRSILGRLLDSITISNRDGKFNRGKTEIR